MLQVVAFRKTSEMLGCDMLALPEPHLAIQAPWPQESRI